MAHNFVGLPVRCLLNDESTLEGVVSDVDAAAGMLVLVDVAHKRDNILLDYASRRYVGRDSMKTLEVVSVKSAAASSKRTPSGRGSQRSSSQVPAMDGLHDPAIVSSRAVAEEPAPLPASTATPSKSKSKKAARTSTATSQAGAASASDFGEEFNFASGLAKFDKRREFEEIAHLDQTDPAMRLVYHNKRQLPDKMKPSENVLSEAELEEQKAFVADHHVRRNLAAARHLSSDQAADSDASIPDPRPEPRHRNSEPAPASSWTINSSSREVSALSLKQVREVISVADIETGPSASQRDEVAAVHLSHLIMHEYFTASKKQPACVILATDCSKGRLALRVGAHLVNHGSRVTVFAPVLGENASDIWRSNLRCLSAAGGKVVRDTEDLPAKANVVVDALAEDLASPFPAAEIWNGAVDWAQGAARNILAINSPYGLNHDTGFRLHAAPLVPTAVACLGAVRPNLVALKPSTRVHLVDIGVSPTTWSRVDSATTYGMPTPFGSHFFVSCNRE